METPSGQLRDMHLLEQATGEIRTLASWTAAFFKGLVEEGFTREEALALTMAIPTERFRALYALKAGTSKRDRGAKG